MRFQKEQRAVLALVRSALGYAAPDRAASAVFGALDWADMERLTRYNGVAPLLRDFAKAHGEIALPSGFSRFLEREYLENLAMALLHERALGEIAGRFAQGGVRFVALKGVALSHLVYPRPDMRPAGTDIDILVPETDYAAARALLLGAGYGLETPGTERHRAAYVGEVHFVKSIGRRAVLVDLHTDFNANHFGKVSRFDAGDFWDSLVAARCGGFDAPHLPAEAALFFLAIHCAANHVFDRLIAFCDIDLLIRKYRGDLDWKRVAERARLQGAAKPLYYCLDFCRQLLDTPVPDDFLRRVSPGRLSMALMPEASLLMRKDKPPKYLERYVHLLLLDDPRLFPRSIALFSRRILSERYIAMRGRRSGAPEAGETGKSANRKDAQAGAILVGKVRAGRDLGLAISTAVGLIGGLEKFIAPSDRVLIKPNFNSPDPYPASTDLAFLREVVALLRSRGVRSIAIGESSGLHWAPTSAVLKKKRVPELAAELGVELIDFDAGEWVRIDIPGRYLKQLWVPQRVLEADKLVYLPNLKTHPVCRFSASLKLAVGMMAPHTRKALHADHPEEKVAELGLALRPGLILLDGRACFVAGGPHRGKRKRPGVIFASADPVAIDVEAVKLLQSYRARNRLDRPVWDLPQIAAARACNIGAGGEDAYRVVTADLRGEGRGPHRLTFFGRLRTLDR